MFLFKKHILKEFVYMFLLVISVIFGRILLLLVNRILITHHYVSNAVVISEYCSVLVF